MTVMVEAIVRDVETKHIQTIDSAFYTERFLIPLTASEMRNVITKSKQNVSTYKNEERSY